MVLSQGSMSVTVAQYIFCRLLAVLAHFKLLHQTEPAQAAARDDRSQL
jgi:hypothetical protein